MKKNISDIGVNDYIRNEIGSGIYNFGMQNFIDYLYKTVSWSELTEAKVFYTSIFSIAFLDGYKSLTRKIESGSAAPIEMELYSFFKSCESFDDIVKVFHIDRYFLEYSLSCSDEFKEMPGLGKISLVKSMTEDDNNHLKKISMLHQNDLDKYDKPLTMDYIYSLVNNYKIYLESKDYCLEQEAIFRMLTGTIYKLLDNRDEELSSIISEINYQVFSNAEKLNDIIGDQERKSLYDLKAFYDEQSEAFNDVCLINKDIVYKMITIYSVMKERDIIKTKGLKKDE